MTLKRNNFSTKMRLVRTVSTVYNCSLIIKNVTNTSSTTKTIFTILIKSMSPATISKTASLNNISDCSGRWAGPTKSLPIVWHLTDCWSLLTTSLHYNFWQIFSLLSYTHFEVEIYCDLTSGVVN